MNQTKLKQEEKPMKKETTKLQMLLPTQGVSSVYDDLWLETYEEIFKISHKEHGPLADANTMRFAVLQMSIPVFIEKILNNNKTGATNGATKTK